MRLQIRGVSSDPIGRQFMGLPKKHVMVGFHAVRLQSCVQCVVPDCICFGVSLKLWVLTMVQLLEAVLLPPSIEVLATEPTQVGFARVQQFS